MAPDTRGSGAAVLGTAKVSRESLRILWNSLELFEVGTARRQHLRRPFTSKPFLTCSGGFQDGKPHGSGRLQGADGSVFQGQWQRGRAQGSGKYVKAVPGHLA